MEKVFDEVNSLDTRCYERYFLSEDILMEHASLGIYRYIKNNFSQNCSILIVCGGGNNGADGITLARLLYNQFDVKLYLFKETKTKIGQLQLKRAKSIGVTIVDTLVDDCDIVVDAIFGSGINRDLNGESKNIINTINNYSGYKIACDIPSGIQNSGVISGVAFRADVTLTMGALKKSLFLDMAKDYVGRIEVIDLGVARTIYESESNCFVLNETDLYLPKRDILNTHKGSFGHLSVIAGEKDGAAVLCAMGGFHLGAGLVSIIAHEKISTQPYIMQSHSIPKNTTAIAIGMGLGKYDKDEIEKILTNNIPKIIDADLFYQKDLLVCLNHDNIILTPHPKEFCSLLKLSGIGVVDIETLQKDRFLYVSLFCKKYPNVILLLKGSNVLIGYGEKTYINPLGSSKLSFGGSGDVLAGFIGSLLAQGYKPIDAAIQGSLIHTQVANKTNKNDYALTPIDLIKGVSYL